MSPTTNHTEILSLANFVMFLRAVREAEVNRNITSPVLKAEEGMVTLARLRKAKVVFANCLSATSPGVRRAVKRCLLDRNSSSD